MLRELAIDRGAGRFRKGAVVSAPLRGVIIKTYRAIRRDGVFENVVTGLEDVAAGKRNVH